MTEPDEPMEPMPPWQQWLADAIADARSRGMEVAVFSTEVPSPAEEDPPCG